MLNQGLGSGYFIVFHSIQSCGFNLLCIPWDWVSMTDSHIGLVHVVRGGKVYPLNSGELEVCGLDDV